MKEPEPKHPPKNWRHRRVWERVRDLISDASFLAHSDVQLGIRGSDTDPLDNLMTLNGATSRALEVIATKKLNSLRCRRKWDPNKKYSDYEFVHQSQTVPDILLRHRKKSIIAFGIELKAWNLLAKESKPSFRFATAAGGFEIHDLLVCFPWVLDGFVWGTPRFIAPYVVSAKWAAEKRDYWWQNERVTTSDTTINQPPDLTPYPASKVRSAAAPAGHESRNFGRFARARTMDDFIRRSLASTQHGLPCRLWRDFFKLCMQPQTKPHTRQRRKMLRDAGAMRIAVRQAQTSGEVPRKIASGMEKCLMAIEGGRSSRKALRRELERWSSARW